MKKLAIAVLSIILACGFLFGGYYTGRQSVKNMNAAIPKESVTEEATRPEESAPPEKDGDSVTYITGFDVSAAATGEWSVVDSCEGDFLGDGKKAALKVYTSAKKNEDGSIMWDDGQNWIVEVETASGGYYTLLTQYVSGGNVYVNVTENKDKKATISVIVAGTGTFSVKQYTYSTSGFVENTVCDTKTDNVLHSSIPFYN